MNDQHWGPTISADIVVIGGGTAGIGVVASLLKRDPSLNITVIEPNAQHFYQPAWTLVGGGAYAVEDTVRSMASVMLRQATWLQASVTDIAADNKYLTLNDGRTVGMAAPYLRVRCCTQFSRPPN
jgi:sulfide:quinone oxidoreductase